MGVIPQACRLPEIIGQLSLGRDSKMSRRLLGGRGGGSQRRGTGQPGEATLPGPWALNPKGLLNLKSDKAKKRNDPFCRVLARGP